MASMLKIKTVSLIIIFSGILCVSAVPQDIPIDFLTKVDTFVEALLGCRDVVGMTVVVVKDNQTVVAKGYGVKDLQSGEPVTEDTMFGIASISKSFAATLLAKVIKLKHDAGENISWDTRIKDVVDVELSDPWRTCNVTLRDLAAHRTGMPGYNKVRLLGLSRHQLVQRLKYFDFTKEFRNSFIYNNYIYGFLTYITETLGGKPWEDLMREHIFQPLQMNTATFLNTEEDFNNFAQPYVTISNGTHVPKPMEFHKMWAKAGGSGAVAANSKDMVKYLQFNLNKGASQSGAQVVARDMMDDLQTAVVSTPGSGYYRPQYPASYTWHTYAMGWRTGDYKGLPMVMHTGTSYGYGALLTLMPSINLGIFTSITGSDSGYPARRLLHIYIMDLLLGDEPWLNLTTACTFPAPWEPSYRRQYTAQRPSSTYTMSASDASKYEGTYGHYGFGNLTVEYNSTISKLQLTYGHAVFELDPTENEDEFFGTGTGMTKYIDIRNVQFSKTGSDGNTIDRVGIRDFEPRAPPEFIRGLTMATAPEVGNYECKLSSNQGQQTSSGVVPKLDSLYGILCMILILYVFNINLKMA